MFIVVLWLPHSSTCVLCCSAPGFCELGISWQSLENPHMKAALAMPKGLTGIYITKTEPMFEASRVLKAGDVLTSFNGEHVC
jgi:flagellar basal body L-ring protein FlgH